MKRKITFILLFIVNMYSYSQTSTIQQQFENNIWYLKSMTIEGNLIPAPNNNEISFPRIYIGPENGYSFEKCSPGFGGGVYSFASQNEIVFDSYFVGPYACQNLENNVFFDSFDYFIWDNVLNSFIIEITELNTNSEQIGLKMELIIDENNKLTYFNSITASNNNRQKLNFKIYPNPTYDFANIIGEEQDIKQFNTYVLYDLTGKKILEKELTESKLDFRGVINGTYLLFFKKDNKMIQFGKIIKK